MLMVKAGAPVDEFIELLLPHLEPGDLLMDGGNSFFMDTIRRNKYLSDKGFLFIGTGVSGGEEGARFGPSIMPGGQPEAYALVEPILTKISAHVNGDPCCTYIGPDGAGHYVKMVHNGIEYGDMQLIAEASFLMKEALGLSAAEMHDIFAEWNKGDLDSYLIEITRDILARVDEKTGKPLVDLILDKAGQKGTGKWTSQSALDLGVCTPTITEAVFAALHLRHQGAARRRLQGPLRTRTRPTAATRRNSSRPFARPSTPPRFAPTRRASRSMAEAQKEYQWDLQFGEIAKIWRGGCIIRARFLHCITDAFTREPEPRQPHARPVLQGRARIVADELAQGGGGGRDARPPGARPSPRRSRTSIPTGGAVLPANVIQAQRDYFGAHTYERTDMPGVFHTEWTK